MQNVNLTNTGRVFFLRWLEKNCAGGGSSHSPPSLRLLSCPPATALLRSGWSTGHKLTSRLAVDWSVGFTLSGRSALAFLSPSARTQIQEITPLKVGRLVGQYLLNQIQPTSSLLGHPGAGCVPLWKGLGECGWQWRRVLEEEPELSSKCQTNYVPTAQWLFIFSMNTIFYSVWTCRQTVQSVCVVHSRQFPRDLS